MLRKYDFSVRTYHLFKENTSFGSTQGLGTYHGGHRHWTPRPLCPGILGGPWAQYIRSGPEGVQGVLADAALSLSISFSSVSSSSIFDLIVSPGATRALQDCLGNPFCFPILFTVLSHLSPPFLITFLMNLHLLGIPFSSMEFV